MGRIMFLTNYKHALVCDDGLFPFLDIENRHLQIKSINQSEPGVYKLIALNIHKIMTHIPDIKRCLL